MASECGGDRASNLLVVGVACNVIVIIYTVAARRLLAWIIGSRSFQMAENPILGESELPQAFSSLLLLSLSL